jgi:hypothetical protein
MKRNSMIIIAVLTLMLLATVQKAGTINHIQGTTETIASQPLLKGTLNYMSADGFGFSPDYNIQAKRYPYDTANPSAGAMWTCKGRKDCSDLKKSGKCAKGTLKTGTGSDGKYGGTCREKQ